MAGHEEGILFRNIQAHWRLKVMPRAFQSTVELCSRIGASPSKLEFTPEKRLSSWALRQGKLLRKLGKNTKYTTATSNCPKNIGMEWNRRYNGQRRPLTILTRLTWNEFRSTLGIGIGLNLWAERRCMMIGNKSLFLDEIMRVTHASQMKPLVERAKTEGVEG